MFGVRCIRTQFVLRKTFQLKKFETAATKTTISNKKLPNFTSRHSFIPVYQRRWYSDEKVEINFIDRKGQKIPARASLDDTLLDVVIDNDLDIESFGVCEGTLGCSTCHVILEQNVFDTLEKDCPPTCEELDMLDMACGLSETSRLGCQIEVTKKLHGCTVKIPEEVSDARDL